MRCLNLRSFSGTALWLACGALSAQPAANPSAAPSKIEPGLEDAVKWKWRMVPAEHQEWGMPLPESLKPKVAPAAETKTAAPEEIRPTAYEVKKGDAVIKIARKFNMTADQLKQFNEMKDDRIVIGQILRIPTPGELLAMPPPPLPPVAKPVASKKKDAAKPEEPPAPVPMSYEQLELETVLVQVFLDREMFSAGGIDGKDGPMFQKVSQIYQQSHPDASNPDQLKAKALASVKQPYANYTLRAEDFRFIKPKSGLPAAEPSGKAGAKKGGKSVRPVPPMIPVTYQDLVSADFLAYTSVWEFLSERFHCDEAFLRRINSKLDETPSVGTVFQVPNVVPFEIENAFDAPMQPFADPAKPVTAAVVDLTRLEITCGGQLVAVMPLASARPGLRGRGSWSVLDVVPQPRMATRQEVRETPKPPSGSPTVNPTPATPAHAAEQFLAPGPNNPVGVLWIQLAKANSREPLPYGLHGTSIPSRMKSQEGIGGFRLTNWDIARAVRLMPAGTALQWKAK